MAFNGHQEREKVSPLFQFTLIFLSGVVIFLMFSFRTSHFRPLDEAMVFSDMTPQTLRKFGGYPHYVSVGMEIDHFEQFNVTKNEFIFAGNVWFEFEGGSVAIEELNHFQFDRASILFRSEPVVTRIDTRLMVRYFVKVLFSTGLVYKDFPVNSHRVDLVLTHPYLSPEEVVFENRADDFVFTSNLHQFGWHKIGLLVSQGYLEARLSELDHDKTIFQPIAGFSIDVLPYGIRSLFAIMLPILLIYFLMFFSLSVDTNASITVALGGITGILAYRYVIEQLSPKTAELMISDYVFFLVLAAAMMIFVLNQIDLFVYRLTPLMKRVGISVIHFFTVSWTIYLLLP